MSPGVKSLWRAQTWSVCIKGLSLVPVPSGHHDNFRRWMSLSARMSLSHGEDKPGLETRIDNASEDGDLLDLASSSSITKTMIKQVIKRKSKLETSGKSSVSALIKPASQYPSKHETRRSFRKHIKSADVQRLHELSSRTYDKPDGDWRSTLDFMLRHTPSDEEMFDLRIVIGRGAAPEALRMLSGLDNNFRQIERRHQSVIRFDGSLRNNGTLVLNVSGPETAVRDSLRDIVRASGKLSAVRILDEKWRERLGDVLGGAGTHQQPVRLNSDDDEEIADDNIVIVHNESAPAPVRIVQPERSQCYVLTRRADAIFQPAEWTKYSFKKYIFDLVYGILPPNLSWTLYRNGPSHQETVVSLILDAFTSEHTRSAVSVSALNMALSYLYLKGPAFRPAARELVSRVETLDLAVDAETIGILLSGASRAGDFNNFNNILKLMVRRHFHLHSHTWFAFLEMIQDTRVKRLIISRMEAQGLGRFPLFAVVIGRQLAPVDLEDRLKTSGACDIGQFVYSQDAKYGRAWLNTTTLNKLLDLLGSHDQARGCRELLDLIHATGRARPDPCTLNTAITHSRRILDIVALLRSARARWPGLRPDAATYNLLFRVAWRARLPNMLRVVWRYALLLHGRRASPRMRHRLTELARGGGGDGGGGDGSGDEGRDLDLGRRRRRSLLQEWEGPILGAEELAAARRLCPPPPRGGGVTAAYLEQRHVARAAGRRPAAELADKLEEAHALDMQIHRLVREGAVVTPAMRDALTVDIPLSGGTGEVVVEQEEEQEEQEEQEEEEEEQEEEQDAEDVGNVGNEEEKQ